MNKTRIMVVVAILAALAIAVALLTDKSEKSITNNQQTNNTETFVTEEETRPSVSFPEGEGIDQSLEEELEAIEDTTSVTEKTDETSGETKPEETNSDEYVLEEDDPIEYVPEEDAPKETNPPETKPESKVTAYEEYLAMSPAQQQAFFESFASPEAYFAWYNAAKAEYETSKDVVAGSDGKLDIGDYMD